MPAPTSPPESATDAAWRAREAPKAQAESAANVVRLRRTAKLAAILTFFVAIAAAAVTREVPRDRPQLLLSLEFADSAEEVRRLAPAAVRDAVIRAQWLDTALLIPSYWALFFVSGRTISRSGGERHRRLGRVVMVTICAAAAFDYAENAAIAAALADAGLVWGVPAVWAYGKWLLFYGTAVALGAVLCAAPARRFHGRLAGLLVGLAGAAGVTATLVSTPWVPAAIPGLFAGLVLLALLWLWDPEYLVRNV